MWSSVRLVREEKGEMSRIWTPLRLREVRLVREERVEMSLIGFPLRASSVRLVQYCRQEISAIPLFPVHGPKAICAELAAKSFYANIEWRK